MKYRNIYTKLVSLFVGCIFAASCTDLDVVPYYQLTADNFYNTRLEIYSAVMRPYTHANAWAGGGDQRGMTIRGELASDQLAWPQKGRHGWDGGSWGRLHYRSWISTEHDGTVWEPWSLAWWGVGFINNTIYEFETSVDWDKVGMSIAEKDALVGELKANRAWHHMRMMDLYGNVPIVTRVGGVDGFPVQPANLPRTEVFAWVEQELLDVAGDMSLLSRELTGRISRAGVYAMLVDLYLNAEVWTGTARWDDVIKYADRLINNEGGGLNGPMVLDPDIFATYANNNSLISREAIFQIAYNRNNLWLGRGSWGGYRESNILNTRDNGNNAIVLTPNAFFAYCENDLRRTNWFMYGIGDGWLQGPFPNIGTGRDNWDYVLGQEEFVNLPLIFAYKPIKAWYTVSGTSATPNAQRRITIERWEAPEFPDEDARLLMENAFNGRTTRDNLITRDNGGEFICPDEGITYIYLSGSTNPNSSGRGHYSWTDRADYRYMWDDARENVGARMYKYHLGEHTDPNYGNNNWNVYRLSWIYFAKAEALMRKNGGVATQEAVDLINSVKQRAFTPEYWNSAEAVANGSRYTTATLTMNELLAERGREFIMEGKRRQDLIRFDVWEFGIPGWWDSPSAGYGNGSGGTLVSSRHTRVFPIPYRAMDRNPNLVQNPGYR
jgi:hypothetical protein